MRLERVAEAESLREKVRVMAGWIKLKRDVFYAWQRDEVTGGQETADTEFHIWV